MPADLAELRRLHEEYVKAKSALKPKSSAGHLTYDMAKNALVVASLDTMPELLDRLEAAEAENAELKGAIERDRTTLADFVTRLKTEMDSRFWLTEGRGSYAWNDDRYRDEFRSAAVSILDAIKPLKKMAADLKNSPRDSESVRAARRDLEAENARLRRVEEILRDNMDSCELRHAEQEIRALDGEVAGRPTVRPRLTDEELECVREEVARVAREALEK